jgi:hypothetical protein
MLSFNKAIAAVIGMPRCPTCKRHIYNYKIIFSPNNTRLICSRCCSELTINKNYYFNAIIWLTGIIVGRWMYFSKFSWQSIIIFIVLTIIIILSPMDTLKLEKLDNH